MTRLVSSVGSPTGQFLLDPQAPQQQDCEERDDRNKRHLSDYVHGLAIYRTPTPKEEAPHGGSGASSVPWGNCDGWDSHHVTVIPTLTYAKLTRRGVISAKNG